MKQVILPDRDILAAKEMEKVFLEYATSPEAPVLSHAKGWVVGEEGRRADGGKTATVPGVHLVKCDWKIESDQARKQDSLTREQGLIFADGGGRLPPPPKSENP